MSTKRSMTTEPFFGVTRAELQSDGSVLLEGTANDGDATDSYGTRLNWRNARFDDFNLNPISLFNHDPDNPIGTIPSINERSNKVQVQALIHPSAKTPTGASIPELCRDGVLRAFSVRFEYEKPPIRKDGYYEIEVTGITEISVVSLPANKPSLFQVRSHLEGLGIAPDEAAESSLRLSHDPARFQALTPDARREDKRSAGPLDYGTLYQKLDALFMDMPDGYYYCFRVYDDYCIAHRPYKGTFWRFPYSVDAQGEVTLGDPVEVFMAWVEVPQADASNSLSNPSKSAQNPQDLFSVGDAFQVLREPSVTLADVRESLRSALRLPEANPSGRNA